jgi:hypothetical protein
MKKENIKQIIQDSARENFNSYSNDYPIRTIDNIPAKEAYENACQLAISYYEIRDDEEVNRDQQLEISMQDYINWVQLELGNWAENK